MAVLIAFVAANALFVTTGGLLRLVSHVLTAPGLVCVLLLGLVLAIRRVASLMTFPGQLQLVIRDGEATFARLTKRRLQIVVDAAEALATNLDGPQRTKPTRLCFLQVYQQYTNAFDTVLLPVLQSLEHMERLAQLGTNGIQLLQCLRDVETITAQQLAPACSILCSASDTTFETQRVALFQEKGKPREARADETLSNLVRQEPVPNDVVAHKANKVAVQLDSMGALRPQRNLIVAVRRLQTAMTLIGRPQSEAAPTKRTAWLLKQICRSLQVEKDSIATLAMLRADLTVRFQAEQLWIPGHENHPVDAMLLPPAPSRGNARARSVMLLCNPNGGLYELHHLQMDWIRFYTCDVQCHVLVYNYRGYGRCTGTPCPRLHNLDGLAIVEYLKQEQKFASIGVHGESIGGLVATYVARYSLHVNALIADRTFATLPALADRMIARGAGNVLEWVLRWDTDNVQNYVEATCAKLVCSDPCDEIILDGASLKSGIALRREWNDPTFALRRQWQSDGVGACVSFADVGQNLRLPCGTRRTRGVSDAASQPHVGKPLTEAMTARFSDAVVSIGRRASAFTARCDTEQAGGHGSGREDEAKIDQQKTAPPSHVCISMPELDWAADAHAVQEHLWPHGTARKATVRAAFPEEVLVNIWMLLARVDGYCGHVLLQAVEDGGYDTIRAWTASLLTWGGCVAPARRRVCSLEPFERNGIVIVPLTVAAARGMLQQLIEQYPPLKFDHDVGFVGRMMDYFNDALEQRWRRVDRGKTSDPKAALHDTKTETTETMPLAIKSDDPNLGWLLPLHCGHNKNYDDTEKQALIGFLRHVGFFN